MEELILRVKETDEDQVEVLVGFTKEQMLPQLIHLGTELCMIGMLEQELIEYFEAKLFWRGIQSLYDRDVSLLWQVDDTSQCQVQEVGGRESGLDAREEEVLAATEVVEGSP